MMIWKETLQIEVLFKIKQKINVMFTEWEVIFQLFGSFLTENDLVSFQNDLLTLRNCQKRPVLPLNFAKIAQKWPFPVLEMAILAKFQGKKGHFEGKIGHFEANQGHFEV